MKNSIQKYFTIGFILSGVIIFSGCEKVIDVNLKSAAPEIVIEGKVTNLAGPYSVTLSKTINYNETNTFPGVSGAVVTISDNLGNSDVLVEGPSGTYNTSTLVGVPGRNYILNVKTNGKSYQAVSTMFPAIALDTIFVDSLTFGKQVNKYVQVQFQDPAGMDNFYKLIEIINGDTLDIINIANDEFEDGHLLTIPVFSDEDPKLKSGDRVEVILQCVDEDVFDYFRQLSEMMNTGPFSAAPANPTSNINNNALGYFSAHSVTKISFIVP